MPAVSPLAPATAAPVVLVHGLYMSGAFMRPLAARLQRYGWRPVTFTYASVRVDAQANAERLRELLRQLAEPTVHLVGHSLGGLVVRLALVEAETLPLGRVVTLGTPHEGSHIARWLGGHGLGAIVGRAAAALDCALPPWQGQRELGSIAGTLPVGLGRVVPGLSTPNDGTVMVAETRLAGMSDHLCLPVSHTGLLLSSAVAAQSHAFLAGGRFRRDAAKC